MLNTVKQYVTFQLFCSITPTVHVGVIEQNIETLPTALRCSAWVCTLYRNGLSSDWTLITQDVHSVIAAYIEFN